MKTTLERLQRELKRHGITHDDIAAACEPPVHRTMVSKVMNARAVSKRVVEAAKKLAAEKQNGRRSAETLAAS